VSVTAVPGFVAAGVAAGIKAGGRPDLALVATADGRAVTAAGVFTANKMTAAPVVVSRDHLAATGGRAAAVICNSGNANAATGARGLADARAMCALTAAEVGCAPDEVLVCSTGLIGFVLPMEAVAAGIPAVVAARSAEGGEAAAEALMTTDTVPKHTVATARAGDTVVTVGGIAKGAAMLEPHLATMLAVLTTDAELTAREATGLLRRAVGPAFNALTVDGAQSTNDTVLLLANGRAGRVDPGVVLEALSEVCTTLALMMADDAEGSTKTVFVTVQGAVDDADAAHVARCIANCQLVKCSWYGQDPYWGRIAAQAGASARAFDPATLVIAYGGHVVFDRGEPAEPDRRRLQAHMAGRRLDLVVDLGQGGGRGRVVTTDLSPAYIDENMRTS
jgi:glutamate N-acetyltransferase/amino-acid N-acetyltransferase